MSSTKPLESQTSPAEPRRNLRFPMIATVEALDNELVARLEGRTSDLSVNGCFVGTFNPFPVGLDVNIGIQMGNEDFEARAKVVSSSAEKGMGLTFVSARPSQIKIFQSWLQDLSLQAKEETEILSKPAPVEKAHWRKRLMLRDLIMSPAQKNILTPAEGKDLLRKLFL